MSVNDGVCGSSSSAVMHGYIEYGSIIVDRQINLQLLFTSLDIYCVRFANCTFHSYQHNILEMFWYLVAGMHLIT